MRRRRVLLGKPGLDGHDRGVLVVGRAIRDAGHEVIYTGIHASAAEIAEAAVQEDVDVVGLSILAGGHMGLTREVLEELRARGGANIPLLVGGTIPDRDALTMKSIGVSAVFPVSTRLADIVAYIEGLPDTSGVVS